MIKIILFVFAMLAFGIAFGQATSFGQLKLDSTEVLIDSGDVIIPGLPNIPNPTPLVTIDIPGLILWEQFLYHTLLLVFSWFSFLFPKLKTKNIRFRTAAIGVTLIAVFVGFRFYSDATFSIGAVLSYILNFLVTTRAYDKIYSELIGKSPKQNMISE